MDIIVSDFDNTLFKRYVGILWPQVRYLEERGYPVYIVTYRAEDQKDFILETLAETKLNIVGIAFAGSRKKDPLTKVALVGMIREKYNIIEALDDDEDAVLEYKAMGIPAHLA